MCPLSVRNVHTFNHTLFRIIVINVVAAAAFVVLAVTLQGLSRNVNIP